MKHLNLTQVCLILIGLGVALRLYHFGQLPIGLNRDEAALGYNAFALSVEGVDEWGQSWPLIFKSFGDYKLPGYIYSLIPFVSVLGTAHWVIRLPSLLAGLIQLYLIYEISKIVFAHRTAKSTSLSQQLMPLLPVVFLSLSPWSVFYSRVAFEANLGLTFLMIALLYVLKPFKNTNLIVVGLSYAAACLTYNTPLLLAPVLIVFLWLLPNLTVKQKGKLTAVLLIIASLVVYLLMPLTQQKQNITIFTDPTLRAFQQQAYVASTNLGQRLFNHHYSSYSLIAIKHWLQTFGPFFMVTHGGSHPWHTVPGHGHHSWSVYILGLVGIFSTAASVIKQLQRNILKRRWPELSYQQAFLFLLLISPLPAIVTVDAPHATRSLLTLFLLPLIAVMGYGPVSQWLSQNTPKRIWLNSILLVTLLLETCLFAYRYFGYFPANHSPSWPSRITPALQSAVNTASPDQPIVFYDQSNEIANDQLYIHILLETKLQPSDYLSNIQYYPIDSAGLSRVEQVNRFYFLNQKDAFPTNAILVKRDSQGVYTISH